LNELGGAELAVVCAGCEGVGVAGGAAAVEVGWLMGARGGAGVEEETGSGVVGTAGLAGGAVFG